MLTFLIEWALVSFRVRSNLEFLLKREARLCSLDSASSLSLDSS